ncbi:hypothetical protein TKK_0016021 [Trichogramma kaykai]|uniref:Farnesol dehydrogenase n=1 Tax=Trichogramma kaykai TaxID=54128 RepID=A0ABD2W9X1_9HYME
MDKWMGKVAVVTGASTGIGLYTAKSLLEHGMIVVGLARRKDKMEESIKHFGCATGQFYAFACDITKEDQVIAVFEEIKSSLGGVHVLVNNAGMMSIGPMSDHDSKIIQQVIDVNVKGLLFCTRQAVHIMKHENEGHIIHVGSSLGHKVLNVKGLFFNVYPATKFAVRALAETLQNEISDTKIRVTHVSPGVVKTDFFQVAGVSSAFLEHNAALNSEDVAEAIIFALSRKPYVHIQELTVRHLDDHYR